MRLVFILSFMLLSLTSFAQRTDNPYVSSQNSKDFKVDYVEITDNSTIISLVFNGGYGKYFNVSHNMKLVASDGNNHYSYPIRAISDGVNICKLDNNYSTPGKKTNYRLNLIFDRIEPGCTSLDIDEGVSGGWNWEGISIKNPIATTPRINLTEAEIVSIIDKHNDGICGIYESVGNKGFKLACIFNNDEYSLIYLGAEQYDNRWKFGDIKAQLRPSASSVLFKATWYMTNKRKNTDAYVIFEGLGMKANVGNEEVGFLKMYPSASNGNINSSEKTSWSGTGFALNEGYISTNYHVIDGAKTIKILGIDGTFDTEYEATIVASDKNNDLAILKITDSKFKGFGIIPYNIKTSVSDVGEDIFVLGYPLTSTMGDEIKLTTGVVSSKTGFQGDISLYQISAPIQPGNSGGPLFDHNGNIIGIVNAKHQGAENVGYAIKTSYLRLLLDNITSDNLLPSNNNIANLPLTGKVKSLRNFVFMIKCTNENSTSYNNSISVVNNTNSSSYNSIPKNNYGQYSSCEYQTTRDNKDCKITSIEVNQFETIVNFNYYFEKKNYWISISPDTYIEYNGTKLFLLNATGIDYFPKKTISKGAGDHSFTLSFPPIPSNVYQFDLIESGDSKWKFYNIRLK